MVQDYAPGMWQWPSYYQVAYKACCRRLRETLSGFSESEWDLWYEFYGASNTVYLKILKTSDAPDDYASKKAEEWYANATKKLSESRSRQEYARFMSARGIDLDSLNLDGIE